MGSIVEVVNLLELDNSLSLGTTWEEVTSLPGALERIAFAQQMSDTF